MAKAKKTSKKGAKPDYIDLDRDNNTTESMKKAAKDKKKTKGKKVVAKKKKVVKENVLIANFIKCVSEENYAEANKYLKQVIEDKLMQRISQSIKPTLF